MHAKLFVGNLPWSIDDARLEDLFRPYGEITSARVITDRDSGRSRGFGFVEIEAPDIAEVISALNGREIDGRPLRVSEAEDKQRESRGPRRDRESRY
jgi:cold-inducible RNA-binding protein